MALGLSLPLLYGSCRSPALGRKDWPYGTMGHEAANKLSGCLVHGCVPSPLLRSTLEYTSDHSKAVQLAPDGSRVNLILGRRSRAL